jgi:hypothetical protein
MKLKFIRNWRQCLRGFEVYKKLELKNWKKYFQKYNNKIPAHNILHSNLQKFLLKE